MNKLLIAFGTLTFNTEMVAEAINDAIVETGKFEQVDLLNMLEIDDVKLIEEYDAMILGTSTWGEGDYPPDPEEFMEKVAETKPNVAGKKVAIFGLGESHYEFFCGASENMKDYFEKELGVRIVGEHLKIDGYPEDEILEEAKEWGKGVVEMMVE